MSDYNKTADLCIQTIHEAADAINNFKPIPMQIGDKTFYVKKLPRRHFRSALRDFVGKIAPILEGVDFTDAGALLTLVNDIPELEDFLIEHGTDASSADLDDAGWDSSIGLAVAVLVANFVHNAAVRSFSGVARTAGLAATVELQPETPPENNSAEPPPESSSPN